jgi:hypothetical protein
MRPTTFLAAALAAATLGTASANETADNCRAYVAENGGDASGCDCLGEAAGANPTLAAALAAIRTPADLEAADEATKTAIAACFPQTDNPAP